MLYGLNKQKSVRNRKGSTVNWIKALPENELPQGNRQVIKIGQQAILFIHHNNQIHAVSNKCPHVKLRLRARLPTTVLLSALGIAVRLTCRAGMSKRGALGVGSIIGNISQQKALAVFPTRLQEGSIWVALPES
jgi:nitrite reductase/ring-hydroxylating ferredoxin subunit